jgi:drug/metabolite transporter (DMT)-like permease
MNTAHRSMAWMAAFTFLWTIVELLGGFLRQPYSPYQVVWTRYAVHLLFMIAIWGSRGLQSLWHTPQPAFQGARSMLMVAMPAAIIQAMAGGGDFDAIWTVFWVAPLLVVTFASMWLGERPPIRLWFACVIALVGTSLMFGAHLPRHPKALLLSILSAVSFSLYVVMTRTLRSDSVRSNLFYTAFGVFVVLSPIVPRLWITPTGHDLAVLVAIGVAGFAGLYALDRAASAAEVSVSAPFIALQVAFAIGAQALLSHHVPAISAWLGVMLIGSAALWTWSRAETPVAAVSRV